MPAKAGRRLVVDASIAGAAGGKTATAPISTRCRDFLDALRTETNCSIVMPPKLKKEWKDHQSNFSSLWLTTMVSRRRVSFDEVAPSNRMRREIERVGASKQSEILALRKDFHLIEAAIITDRTVISLDEIVRRLFQTAAQSVVAIKKVVWVNPNNTAEQPIIWLKSGAKPERERILDYR